MTPMIRKYGVRLILRIALVLSCLPMVCFKAWGQEAEISSQTSGSSESDAAHLQYTWWESTLSDACTVRYETAALFAGITAVGLNSWDWGSSTHYRFHSEDWFGADTGSGGADKLGHAFSAYTITNLLIEAIHIHEGRDDSLSAPLTASMLSMGLMTYVEVFDGFSVDHGFAYEDMVMNVLGIGCAYFRHRIPGIRDKIDFRMEYLPSGHKGFRPLSDYSGQRYLMALKLSGFEALRKTPLRYLELQGGYYTRGFLRDERLAGEERERTPYLAIGVNLSELFFGSTAIKAPPLVERVGRVFFEHVQVPYTSYRFYENTEESR